MTELTEYDKVITVDIESGGKLVGVATALGEHPDAGDLNEEGKFWIVHTLEHNFPEPACSDPSYFITNYWFNLTDQTFVKVESEQPNDHAIYDPLTKTWDWDAALVLIDIRRYRNSLLARSDWTQVSDTSLTSEQKAAAVEYRRQLRDVTVDIGNPVNWEAIDWPTIPDFLA